MWGSGHGESLPLCVWEDAGSGKGASLGVTELGVFADSIPGLVSPLSEHDLTGR